MRTLRARGAAARDIETRRATRRERARTREAGMLSGRHPPHRHHPAAEQPRTAEIGRLTLTCKPFDPGTALAVRRRRKGAESNDRSDAESRVLQRRRRVSGHISRRRNKCGRHRRRLCRRCRRHLRDRWNRRRRSRLKAHPHRSNRLRRSCLLARLRLSGFLRPCTLDRGSARDSRQAIT
jgi:hypothetical protein